MVLVRVTQRQRTPGVSRRKQGLYCMGTLIPLAPALTLDLTTIYAEVWLCWITQTGCGTPFEATDAPPIRSPPGLARSAAQVARHAHARALASRSTSATAAMGPLTGRASR